MKLEESRFCRQIDVMLATLQVRPLTLSMPGAASLSCPRDHCSTLHQALVGKVSCLLGMMRTCWVWSTSGSLLWAWMQPHEQCRLICCTRNEGCIMKHGSFRANVRCFPCSSFLCECLSLPVLSDGYLGDGLTGQALRRCWSWILSISTKYLLCSTALPFLPELVVSFSQGSLTAR